MWSDNETEKDFLNFSGVAGTVAEIITQATGRPTSIGISGSWGAGKSSMIKLVRAALVLALFTVGNVYVSLCKKSAYAPFSARRRS